MGGQSKEYFVVHTKVENLDIIVQKSNFERSHLSLCIVCGTFCTVTAEDSSCERSYGPQSLKYSLFAENVCPLLCQKMYFLCSIVVGMSYCIRIVYLIIVYNLFSKADSALLFGFRNDLF